MARPAHLLWVGLLVAIAYYAGAIIGFALTLPGHPVSTLWPPNSILLSAMLLVPTRMWPLVLLSAFPAHLAVQLQSGVPLLMILAWFVSNCSEALIGAFLLRRFIKGPIDFATVKSVATYVGSAVILAPFVSSFVDAAFVVLIGWKDNSYWQVWLMRLPANVLAAVAIPPVILLWAFKGVAWLSNAPWRRYGEAFLLLGGLLTVSFLVFGWQTAGPETVPALLYLPLPFLLWAAMRFGPVEVSTSLLLVVLTSIWTAAQGRGPFLTHAAAANVLSLQMFLIAISLPLMFLAGCVEEERDKTRKLSESETRFRSMADTAPVLIWMAGTDRRCTFFNKGWLDFTGRTLAQELGNGWTKGVHPDDFERGLQVSVNSFNARREFTVEYRLRRFDGTYGWVLDTGVPRFATDGTFIGYIGTAIDITEHKRSEGELRQQRADLAHVARISMMGELAASLAHELNQPLTAILSNAQAARRFLADKPTDLEEIHEILHDIVEDNNRAGEVIHRMRALVKKEELKLTALDFASVIQDVVLLVHSDTILQNIKTGVELDENLPLVRGDRVQLQQVLLNIFLNAFDAMKECPASERQLKLKAERQDTETIKITVEDSGPGLSDDKFDKVFEPFYTTKPEGLGMGLSICRSIIEAHGGRLWAENNPHRGATFYFTLPAGAGENEESQLIQ